MTAVRENNDYLTLGRIAAWDGGQKLHPRVKVGQEKKRKCGLRQIITSIVCGCLLQWQLCIQERRARPSLQTLKDCWVEIFASSLGCFCVSDWSSTLREIRWWYKSDWFRDTLIWCWIIIITLTLLLWPGVPFVNDFFFFTKIPEWKRPIFHSQIHHVQHKHRTKDDISYRTNIKQQRSNPCLGALLCQLLALIGSFSSVYLSVKLFLVCYELRVMMTCVQN